MLAACGAIMQENLTPWHKLLCGMNCFTHVSQQSTGQKSIASAS
jgi:hypothetical protein